MTNRLFWGIVIISLVFFVNLEPAISADYNEFDKMIAHAMYQTKAVLVKKLTASDIEKLINQSRSRGAYGLKINYHDNGNMGWSLEDSKGRELYSIVFSFLNKRAKEGIYYGPKMSSRDAVTVNKQHNNALSKNFNIIRKTDITEPIIYDLGDKCTAASDFIPSGKTGSKANVKLLMRTMITVDCK